MTDDETMTDVEAYTDDDIVQFLEERKFNNPHAVDVRASNIAFKGNGEKLDGDMIPISLVSDGIVQRSFGIKRSSSCTRDTYRTFWRKT